MLSITLLLRTGLGENWALKQISFYCEPNSRLANLCEWRELLIAKKAPLLNRYEIEYVEKTVSGPLFDEDTLSETDRLLRSYPSPEVDAAWEARTDVGIVLITGDEVSRLGKDPLKSVKAPDEWGTCVL